MPRCCPQTRPTARTGRACTRALVQRLVILGLGIVSTWLIVFVVFDFADRRLPWAVALGLSYAVGAYVILPRAVRMGLKILQQKRVPRYTLTGDGLPGDPVNLALIGTMQQLRSAFAATGWTDADRLGVASSWRMVRAFVLNSPYPTAPFSTLYLFGRGQDIGFPEGDRQQPAQAPSRALLGSGPCARPDHGRDGELLAQH